MTTKAKSVHPRPAKALPSTTRKRKEMKATKVKSYLQEAETPLALTPAEYGGLQAAYDFFNVELFSGELPDVFITYQRKAHSAGHFAADRYSLRSGEARHHELS